MTINELAELLQSSLKWYYYHSDDKTKRSYGVSLVGIEIREKSISKSPLGKGSSPECALNSLAAQLKGQLLATNNGKCSFVVPKSLIGYEEMKIDVHKVSDLLKDDWSNKNQNRNKSSSSF